MPAPVVKKNRCIPLTISVNKEEKEKLRKEAALLDLSVSRLIRVKCFGTPSASVAQN